MQYFKYFILFAVTALTLLRAQETEEMIYGPYPHTHATANGYSGTALFESKDAAYLNPAFLSFYRWLGLTLDYYETYPGFSYNYMALTFPFVDYSAQLGLSSTVENGNWSTTGFRFDTGLPKLWILRTGAGFHYYDDDVATRYAFESGFLYRDVAETDYAFGIHEFSLGLRLHTAWVEKKNGSSFLSFEPTPGVAAKVLDSRFIESSVWLDYPYKYNYIEFPTYFGFNTKLFKTLRFSMGFTGKEYFETTLHHASLGVEMPLDSFDAGLWSAQSRSHTRNMNLTEQPGNAYLILGKRFTGRDREIRLKEMQKDLPSNFFSPNGDGVQDTVSIEVPDDLSSVLSDWTLLILDEQKKTKIQLPNQLAFFEKDRKSLSIIWDGRDTEGNTLPDGKYTAVLVALLKDSQVNDYPLGTVQLDTTLPRAKVVTEKSLITMQEASESGVSFSLEEPTEDFKRVTYTIEKNGSRIEQKSCDRSACELNWFPEKDKEGHYGIFNARFSITDRAGNTMHTSSPPFAITTADTPAVLQTDTATISSEKLFKEGIEATLILNVRDIDIKNLQIAWTDSNGEELHREKLQFAGKNRVSLKPTPANLNGNKELWVRLLYVTEDEQLTFYSQPIHIDDTPPEIELSVQPTENFIPSFTPLEQLHIVFKVNDNSPIFYWSIKITDARGREYFFQEGRGSRPPPVLTWDGTRGSTVEITSLEKYTITARAIDSALNRQNSAPVTFTTGLFPVSENPTIDDDESITDNYLGTKIKLSHKKQHRITLNSIQFQPSSDTPVPGSEAQVDVIAAFLKDNPQFQVVIEGHVHGTIDISSLSKEQRYQTILNRKTLSGNRAKMIATLLQERGIDEKRLKFIGRGSEVPIAKDDSPAEAARNRRVEFILSTAKEAEKEAGKE